MNKKLPGGYLNLFHKTVAEWVFKYIKQGQLSYHSPDSRPRFSGHDVRHVLQAHGWVMEDLRHCLDKSKEQLELERMSNDT